MEFELILALSTYFKVSPSKLSKKSDAIISLANTINEIHKKAYSPIKRTPGAVYMKLCNFLPFDPYYPGVGLKNTGKYDRIIWNRYANDRPLLETHTDDIMRKNS